MSNSAEKPSSGIGKYASFGTEQGGVHGVGALALVDNELISRAICGVLSDGAAILFGTTKDGGAVSIQVFSGDEVAKGYGATTEALQAALTGLIFITEA